MAMETRRLGRTNLEVGVIGLGAEHLTANRENMDAVLDVAVPAGVNYIDLIYNDPLKAHAEHWEAIGPAIRQYRERLVLALHWGFIYHEPLDHCQRCFDEALQLLGNDYAEIALLSKVDTPSLWKGWVRESMDRLREYQCDGRVGFLGISSHNAEVARRAVESGEVDVLMFPINLYQHHDKKDRQTLLEVCMTHDVGVVAMKTYYGGRLLETQAGPTGITPTQCLHYVLSLPIATAVPGARDADEMRQTLAYVEASATEKQYIALHDDLVQRLRGQCVVCQHCLPCPQGIPIPVVIECLDYVQFYGNTPFHTQHHRDLYDSLPARGSDCIECEVCLQRCHFGVNIMEKMHQAAQVFESATA